ncbi:MAG: hypothetical protein HY855_15615 [Burkholderiales bacterium]|nr:hypothetical protein [Burkholderiales bacterium]
MSKIGTELLVNTQTTGDQTLAETARLNNGGFVTVWVDWADSSHSTAADGSQSGIKAQLFTAGGVKAGKEILVNTATINWQQDPHVAVLKNGNFVVTWTDNQGDASGRGVKAQVFNATGDRVGGEIAVNTTTPADQVHPQVAALKNGGFVVAWDDWSDGIDVRAQVFGNTGARVGSEILVNATKDGAQDGTRLAALDDGGFVVTWTENWRDVKSQAFDASGNRQGGEVLVNTTTAGGQSGAQVTALGSAAYLVAWNDDLYGPSDGSGAAVKAQLFAVDKAVSGGSGNDVLTGGAGNDTLINVERLRFNDIGVALDLDGHAAPRPGSWAWCSVPPRCMCHSTWASACPCSMAA